ncbi:MAG TPA: serine hydrolase domain-containing protein, partial [Anditalea sp.]|nr:serine hydrolase domain-containing protein [Anditalea sp.]
MATFIYSGCQSEYTEFTRVCTYNDGVGSNLHPKADAYQDLLNQYVRKGLPGIVLLVRDNQGEWVGSAGKADIEQNVAMSPCHISKAASITKMFVAVATLQLVEEGVLQLDERITKWLPSSVTNKIENADAVTLRQLLNHTTGIYDIIDDDSFYLSVLNDPSKIRTLEDLAEFVYKKPAVFPPGERASYSNTNTLLVSMIIEKATGKPHDQVIRERTIIPLGLTDTHYYSYNKLPTNTAQGYFDLYNNGTILNVSNYYTASGYGGLYSNVFDLQIFIEALFREQKLLSTQLMQHIMEFTATIENGRQLGTGIMKDFLFLQQDQFA